MTRTPSIAALVVAAWLSVTPLAAQAADCTASATGIVFGNYDPGVPSDTTSVGQLTVRCSGFLEVVSYQIALSTGGSGSFANRWMTFGGATLSYQLYSTAALTTIWGNGSAGTATVADSYFISIGARTRNYSVYGRIPANQWPPAGSYADLIMVVVTY